jgi:hypothetical protein
VGLGGQSPDTGLLQAGSWEQAGPSYFAFYEFETPTSHNGYTSIPKVNVRAGDSIHAQVTYSSSALTATFYVEDLTNGTYGSYTLLFASQYYDGRDTDFIDERPTQLSGPFPLAKYNYIQTTAAEVQDLSGTWHFLGTQSHASITMENKAKVLADVSTIGNNQTFYDYWIACN